MAIIKQPGSVKNAGKPRKVPPEPPTPFCHVGKVMNFSESHTLDTSRLLKAKKLVRLLTPDPKKTPLPCAR